MPKAQYVPPLTECLQPFFKYICSYRHFWRSFT